MKRDYIFSSESVTEGHPDKIADQVSDAVLDAALDQDPTARVACETLVTTGLVLVAGEITTSADLNIQDIARATVAAIGYTDSDLGFDAGTCAVINAIQSQSPDIAMGVDQGGAGDQGMMFGYASNETEELMPMPIMLAHKLTERLTEVRRNGTLDYLRPDGKSQVSVRYVDDHPVSVEKVLISTQHTPEVGQDQIRRDLIEQVIDPVIPSSMRSESMEILVNPTGRFVKGGPHADTGLTGRKIIVDTYGGFGRHGGGAFSGKDPTKVDRSASYMMRYVAKNVVAAGLADRCEVQIAYAIGEKNPLSLNVNTFGTGKVDDMELVQVILKTFDLTPGSIIERLKLRRPIYRKTAAYGHFGRSDPDFTWEECDAAEELKAAAQT